MTIATQRGRNTWMGCVLTCFWVTAACSGGADGPMTMPDASFVFTDTGPRDGATSDSGNRDAGRDSEPPGRCELELCGATGGGDGLDNDCDGAVDEDCPCIPGDTRSCFRGRETSRGVGACRDGTMTCMGSLEFGRWSACTGDVSPAAEICDPAGLDEDCDGAPNEGCACNDGDPPTPCGTDEGACEQGTQRCSGGMLGECTGGVGPSIETCNGIDDDCDGRVDDEVTRPCGSDVGECAVGVETCVDGEWEPCPMGMGAVPESCDGLDNDCDGAIDEDLVRECGSDVGECSAGMQTCVDGTWGACTGPLGPTAESCNGLDDDCDGATDEDLTRPCGSDIGACVSGTETCAAGAFGACVGSVGPAPEACDGAIDDDCDGMVDEGCGCVVGTSRPCGSSTGICTTGIETCVAGGTYGPCVGGTGPGAEVCDGVLDENCDGVVDEGCGCTSGMTRPCGTDVGDCVVGTQTCSAGVWGMCTGGTGPTTEDCNGGDEDCDGMVDEGCACTTGMTRPCGTDVGECTAGTQTCTAMGTWGTCTGSVGPVPETCDMRDNDCDMMIDEGVCATVPPVIACPASITQQVLSTASLTGSASDPDGGPVTYAWTVTARPVGSTANPIPPNAATTSFFLDASGSYTLRLCATDDEMQTTCCDVTITSTPRGRLHVELAWSTVFGDADLHIENVGAPADGRWFTSNDCYWANPAPDWGAAGVAGNPTLDRDDTDGYGPENVTIDMSPTSGTYHIGVHYYCSHSVAPRGGGGGGSVAPGDGPTSATIRVYCDGALIATYTGLSLDRTDDWITVARVDYPSCTGMSVNRRTNGTRVLPAGYTGTLGPHCEIPCATNADCPGGERCARVGGGGPPRDICIRM